MQQSLDQRHHPEYKFEGLTDQVRTHHFHPDNSPADRCPFGNLHDADNRISLHYHANPLLPCQIFVAALCYEPTDPHGKGLRKGPRLSGGNDLRGAIRRLPPARTKEGNRFHGLVPILRPPEHDSRQGSQELLTIRSPFPWTYA